MPGTDLLSDKAIKAAIKAAVATGKAKRVSDGAGMYIEARPNEVAHAVSPFSIRLVVVDPKFDGDRTPQTQ